ncbi:MAG: cysteine desulfurase [Clostridia bacterium]|nr:cysteine desulfurase [Clostridia bacterium]
MSGQTIYADNAASTRLSAAAKAAMLPCFDLVYANPSAPHAMGRAAAAALTDARAQIAAALGCDPAELYFNSGGTEADAQALRTAAILGAQSGKRHIISTAFEHHAVLRTLDLLGQEGFEIELLAVPENGVVTAPQVAAAIRPDTCLVSVMFANNEIGTLQPVAEIGAVCRAAGVLFHTDAAQAAGQTPIDVRTQQIDLLSLSAHKFHGPKGVGALYARKGLCPVPLLAGGGQERGARPGTENLPGIVGMAAALAEATACLNETAAALTERRDWLIAGLSEIPQAVLNGDAERRLPGNVNFSFAGIEGEALLLLLDARGICASAGAACTAGAPEPSHVLLAIGRSPALARGALRLTLSADVTDAEIEAILRAVRETVALLRAAPGRNNQ